MPRSSVPANRALKLGVVVAIDEARAARAAAAESEERVREQLDALGFRIDSFVVPEPDVAPLLAQIAELRGRLDAVPRDDGRFEELRKRGEKLAQEYISQQIQKIREDLARSAGVNIIGGGSQLANHDALRGSVVTVSADYTLQENVSVVRADATDAEVRITLPAAQRDRIVTVKRINQTGSDVFVVPTGTETIEFDTELSLLGSCRPAVRLLGVSGGWEIIGTALP